MTRAHFRLTFFAMICLAAVSQAAVAAEWKAGAARVKITPGRPMWMSGYAARDHVAEGTLGDLWAKALVLEDPAGHRAVLVTMDLVGIDRGISTRVRDAIQQKHQLDRSAIALCVSHTHSGPVVGSNLRTMYVLDDEQQRRVDEYTAALGKKLVAVADEAIGKLAPATLEWGVGQAEFAVNRRNNAEALVPKLRSEGKLQGPTDHDLPVLAVRDAKGELTATVFGYACHATTLDGYQWSGDWPGAAQAELEKAHPGATALFVAGCGADQNPVPRRKVELVETYGQEAAKAVDAVLAGGHLKRVEGNFTGAYSEIDLPFAEVPTREQWVTTAESKNKYEVLRAKAMLAKLDRGETIPKTYPYPVEVWRLGPDLKWVLLGGEVVVDYSLRLKKELGENGTWVAGYTNDVMAYIPSLRVLKEGGYEGGGAMVYYGLPAPWAPETEEMIVKEVHRLLDAR
jgi:neutral ceramidase